MTQQQIDVPRLAHSYRRLVLWFGAQLILSLATLLSGAVEEASATALVLSMIILVGLLATLAALAIYSYRTAAALGSSVAVLWAIAMFLPCANAITLLVLSAKATSACRANGIPVGFLGPKELSRQPPDKPPVNLPPSINP